MVSMSNSSKATVIDKATSKIIVEQQKNIVSIKKDLQNNLSNCNLKSGNIYKETNKIIDNLDSAYNYLSKISK